MPKLLKIDASPRDASQSFSRELGEQFAREWKETHRGDIIPRDLASTHLPFVDTQWIAGAYTAPDQHTEAHKAALRPSDELIAELASADHILITTPMYNFAIPAVLKAWIDHIVRLGKTFNVSAAGAYTGLLTGKKATVIIASGGQYAGTPMDGYDQETPYLRNILGFIGITDVTFVRAGGVSKMRQTGQTRGDFLAPFQSEVHAAAATTA